jgi:formiminoglutamase
MNNSKVAIIGYACDEGVRRNNGRVGAKDGPDAIRKCMGELPPRVTDKGNITCENGNLEKTQEQLGEMVAKELKLGNFPLVIGGGHDIAYGHFLGINKAIKGTVGIINLDAHFDLRPFHNGGNSGTPFSQISTLLKAQNKTFNYLPIGIRESSNSAELYQTAQKLNVHYIPMEECTLDNIPQIKKTIQAFMDEVDCIYLTIDLDGFSSAYCPGVSAASPIGFRPKFILDVMHYIFKSKKVISCDIAEMNPVYDKNQSTALLSVDLTRRVFECVLAII